MKLPIEVKTKWIAALRSGEYPQAQHELFDGRGFCCLGVLAEVLEPGVIKSTIDGEGDLYGCYIRHPELAALFAQNTELRAEIRKRGVDLHTWEEADRALMAANDSGMDFEHIANLIEEYL